MAKSQLFTLPIDFILTHGGTFPVLPRQAGRGGVHHRAHDPAPGAASSACTARAAARAEEAGQAEGGARAAGARVGGAGGPVAIHGSEHVRDAALPEGDDPVRGAGRVRAGRAPDARAGRASLGEVFERIRDMYEALRDEGRGWRCGAARAPAAGADHGPADLPAARSAPARAEKTKVAWATARRLDCARGTAVGNEWTRRLPDPARAGRDGVEIAFVREGAGGYPLLLVHGWPETKRIWWRNIEPLAAAGFEVIVPDLRGFGDSGLAPDGFYDLAAHARDLHALVHDVLGHERCAAAGGDLGGGVIQDLGLRFEGSSSASACSTRCCRSCASSTSSAGIPRGPARGADGGRLLPPPGPRGRRARGRARHRRTSGAATSRSSTARASGRRPAPSTASRSTS